MAEPLRPDLCVIGAGSGGLSVAAAAAMMGVEVVLIEKGTMGGDCLNTGCVPSKSLIAAARVAHEARQAARFGIVLDEPRTDFSRVHDHVREVIGTITPTDSEARFKAMGVRVLRGVARFTGRRQVEVGGETIVARRFIIATGSSPLIPPIRGIETVRVLTHETIFDLTDLPARLLVVGGGPIGVELAQAFRRLGSKVTVLEAGTALSREDPELAAEAIAALREEGVDLREGVRISHIDPAPGGLSLFLEGDATPIEATHLLVAAGRKPNVEGLGLEAAGVKFDRKGITVGRDLRSSNRRIYAVGDVAGGAQFTHAASYHASLVLRSTLFRSTGRVEERLIPRVTYTDPEIAVAGLSEAQAREAGYRVNILRWPFAENDRAQTGRETRGHIKVVCGRKGEILGAGIVGPHAGELISMWQLAVSRRMKISDVAQVVLPYPTLSEVSRRAAVLSYGPSLRNPWLKRVLRLLRTFG